MSDTDGVIKLDASFHGPRLQWLPEVVARHQTLSDGAKLLYAELYSRLRRGVGFKGFEDLAEIRGCSTRSIQRYIGELEQVDLLQCSYDQVTRSHSMTMRNPQTVLGGRVEVEGSLEP